MTDTASAQAPLTAGLVDQARQLCFGRPDDLGVITISGPDASRFLHNQTTQDILSLPVGGQTEAGAVDRQGKIQGVFSVWRVSDESFWLVLDSTQIPSLITHFEKFHILEKFELLDQTQNFAILMFQGAGVPELLPELLETLSAPKLPVTEYSSVINIADKTIILLNHLRYGLPTAFLIGPQDIMSTLQSAVVEQIRERQPAPWTPELDEILRVESGTPRFDVDMDRDTLLPETGLTPALVSYDKGCYLGQEVIARVKTYGSLQKALFGLMFSPGASLPPYDAVCLVNGISVGTVKSAIHSPTLRRPIALAYLDKSHRIPGSKLDMTINGEPYTVEVVMLPFVQPGTDGQQSHNPPKTRLDQALRLFSEGQDPESIEALQNLLADYPDYSEAYEALGVILGRQDRLDEAIAMMHRLLELDPDHVLAHTNLSIFYLKQGDKEKAEEEKAKATIAGMRKKARESGFDFAKLEADRKLREQQKIQQLEERAALFIDALKYKPDDPLGNFGLGSTYLELQRYQDAIAPLEKTIQAQPKHSVAYLSLGKAYEGVNQPEKAKQSYEKGIEAASSKGDMMPLQEMQQRLHRLG